jgi:hypothetical protein
MGFDARPLLTEWAVCSGVVVAIAAFVCHLSNRHPGLVLGFGAAAFLMSALALVLWFWFDLSWPRYWLLIAISGATLAAGGWAVITGARALG